MAGEPISGREPALGGKSDLSGDEPFLGGEGSLAALLQGLGDFDDAPSKALVGRFAGVIPQLAPYLDGDDARLRRTAARLIGLVAANHPKTRDQTVPLVIKIVDDAIRLLDWPVATMAIERLGDTADRQAAVKLAEIVASGSSYRIERSLPASFGRLGMVALPILMDRALEGSYHERAILAAALREVCASTPEAIPVVAHWLLPLTTELATDEFHEVNTLFAALGPAVLVEPMLAFATDKSRDMSQRVRVLYRLRIISDPRVTAPMFDILNSDERQLWHIAAMVLSRVRIRRDIPRVLELIEHPDPDIRRHGIRIAGKRRIKASVRLVTRALAEPAAVLRREAVRALGRIGHPGSVEPLLPLLKDRATSVQRETVWALSMIDRRSRVLRR